MSKHIFILGLVATFIPGWAADNGKAADVVIEVDGVGISRSEFEQKSAPRLFQARNAYYEAERKVADEMIEEYLLEAQAKKEKVTVAELLERHINGKLPPDPSDDALRVYYEGLDTKETFEAVKVKIRDHLRERRIAKLKTAYLQSLREQATVSILLNQPRAYVPLGSTPVRGPANAPVTIIEYADYECPFCQQIQPALEKLQTEYKEKVAFAYKDVPLPSHPNAQKAAEAKYCAGEQGKYWEFHDLLVASKEYGASSLKQNARTLNLDTASFDKCLDSAAPSHIIQANMNEAQNLGLQGTPSFFINGRFFSGVLTYEKLRDVVEEELRNADAGQKTARR